MVTSPLLSSKKQIYSLRPKWVEEEDHVIRYGFTGRAKLLDCARRGRLDSELAKTSAPVSRPEYFGIGQIFHAYQDLFHTARMGSAADILFSPPPDDNTLYEAQRLFDAYSLEHNPDYFGKVLGTEVSLPVSEEARRKLYVIFGLKGGAPIEEYQAYIDLVVYLDEAGVDRLNASLEGTADHNDTNEIQTIPGPGIYLVDTKTDFAELKINQAKYTDAIQFMMYQFCWNVQYPDRQCNGCIISSTVKSARPKFCKYFQPAVGEREANIIRGFCSLARQRYHDERSYNPLSCYSGFRPCPHALSKLCTRGPDFVFAH